MRNETATAMRKANDTLARVLQHAVAGSQRVDAIKSACESRLAHLKTQRLRLRRKLSMQGAVPLSRADRDQAKLAYRECCYRISMLATTHAAASQRGQDK